MLTRQEIEDNGSRPSEIRPDTPDLEEEDVTQAQARAQVTDAMSVEEMEQQLLETARQASLQERARQIAARELEDDVDGAIDEDEDVDAEPRAPAARSRPGSPPPAEYNETGRLTARSKGKGRAN